jgi:basic membrane protein A and related proteins
LQEDLVKISKSGRRLSAAAAVLGISALALAACGAAPTDSGSSSKSSAPAIDFLACIVSDSGGFDDQSFNQSSWEGLQKAKADFGVQVKQAESKSNGDFATNLNGMVAAKCDLTYSVGFLLADATKATATANPDSKFAIIDDSSIELPNVKSLTYDTAQAAYLAGYVAAAQTKTGTVATFGGMKIPTVTIFMEGFAQGVAKYNEAKGKDVKLLGWDSAKQDGTFTGDFEKQDKGKQVTQTFLDQGADIVMPVAGPVGKGAAAAVKEANAAGKDAALVWVDSDGYNSASQYKELMLTSVMKAMDTSVEDVTKQASEGKFSNEAYVGTLANGGVSIAPFHDFDSKVSDETKKEVEDLKQQIIDGKIKAEAKN